MKYFMGIDPGKTGALAILDQLGRVDKLLDYSTTLTSILSEYTPFGVCVYLEKVHSMPGQGVSSTFTFGENFGWWKGVLQALQIPFVEVAPQTWQKGLVPKKENKTEKPSLIVARQMFPESDLKLAKHHNRADALLIAYSCFRDRKGAN